MPWFHRISATLVAGVERLIAPIENHDAVVEAAVREARGAVARSNVRLATLQRESTRLQAQLARLEEDAQRWIARARELAAGNQEAALECLKRRHGAEARAATLRQSLAAQADTIVRLTRDIGEAEQRIALLSQQRHLLRTRESTADAMNQVSGIDLSNGDLTGTLERWEVRITEAELAAGTGTVFDPLESACAASEERSALLAELAELTRKQESHHAG
ncbi:MAG: PspA/IM30 family protein [Gammaproteobacteria bacterium]